MLTRLIKQLEIFTQTRSILYLVYIGKHIGSAFDSLTHMRNLYVTILESTRFAETSKTLVTTKT